MKGVSIADPQVDNVRLDASLMKIVIILTFKHAHISEI